MRAGARLAGVALRGGGHASRAHDELANAGLDVIELAACACLDGHMERTRRLARIGLAECAAASLELDEALEGELGQSWADEHSPLS